MMAILFSNFVQYCLTYRRANTLMKWSLNFLIFLWNHSLTWSKIISALLRSPPEVAGCPVNPFVTYPSCFEGLLKLQWKVCLISPEKRINQDLVCCTTHFPVIFCCSHNALTSFLNNKAYKIAILDLHLSKKSTSFEQQWGLQPMVKVFQFPWNTVY